MRINLGRIINSKISEDIAIDLGAYKTAIYIKDKGIVLNDMSYIAQDTKTGEIVALGEEAYLMQGKNPPCVKIINPIKNGVISDMDMTVKMISAFLEKVYTKTLIKPRMMISLPSDATDVESHAIAQVLRNVGAREVFILSSPLAAAIGAGCDITLARGMHLVHIGEGRTDVASISLNRTVVSKSITVAGDTFSQDIIKHIKNAHNLNIGILTAEAIKNKIGCAYPFEKLSTMSVSGCDTTTGLPRFLNISSEEIRECMMSSLTKISNLIKTVIKDTPPELQSDIIEDGILLTGGGAMLSGLDKYLRQELELKVFVAENPMDCVINGLGAELSNLDEQNPQGGKYYNAVE